MEGTTQPVKKPRSSGSIIKLVAVAVVIVVVVVILAVTLATPSMFNSNQQQAGGNQSPSGGSNPPPSSGNPPGGGTPGGGTPGGGTPGGGTNNLGYQIHNGDYLVMSYTSDMAADLNGTWRMEFTNVTSIGYTVEMTQTVGSYTAHYTWNATFNETLGTVNTATMNMTMLGVKLGSESLSTPFGIKKVDHWRDVNETGGISSTIDYYIGATTPVVYKMVVRSGNADQGFYTSTIMIVDTNIDSIKNTNT